MELMLFTNDVTLARRAAASGVARIVIDLEQRGKAERQHGYHLECNAHRLADLTAMKAAVDIPVLCRVNPIHSRSSQEIDAVVAAGADVVMLPMFRRPEDVGMFLRLVGGRARTSLLFETREAVSLSPRLDPASFDEVYVGLNDLSLSYGAPFCYELLVDGVVDQLRACFPDKPFGFGGITVLAGGSPVPTRLILMELARLRCTQVIIRRAFMRDIQHRDLPGEVQRLLGYYEQCRRRSSDAVASDRNQVHQTIMAVARERAGLAPVKSLGAFLRGRAIPKARR